MYMQRPYAEELEDIAGTFLFDNSEKMEEKIGSVEDMEEV